MLQPSWDHARLGGPRWVHATTTLFRPQPSEQDTLSCRAVCVAMGIVGGRRVRLELEPSILG